MNAKRKAEPVSSEVLKQPGAAAALARLEKEELSCYESKESLQTKLAELAEPPLNAAEDIKTIWRNQKDRLESDLLFAFKRWDVARKSLSDYHDRIKPSEREGEKVSVAEAKEIFAQFTLSMDLALEQAIIAGAQSAALCDSPEAFYAAHAQNWRTAKASAMASAKADGALPGWVGV